MLQMLLISCLTLQINAPKVKFPTPPDPAGVVEVDFENDMMLVPIWYWVELGNFYIDYDAALERYESYFTEEQ